jgi:hypothetical protein
MFRKILLFLLLYLPSILFSQEYFVGGRVRDSATAEPLAFVNIVINDSKQGGVTDIDGRFRLTAHDRIETLAFSYVGYRKMKMAVASNNENLQIQLSQLETRLSEVVIMAGENPAHRIIRNAVDNRKINNPRNIGSYSFTSYDKMIFTLNPDSLRTNDPEPLDPSDAGLIKAMENQHLFMLESVSEHKYLFPDRHKDKIVATRVSGFKDPLFIFLISQMQSTSFYDELISIAGTNYLNPLSPNSENHYFFHLKDTIYGDRPIDTTFIIGFKPRPGKNFDGMKGLLYISNNRWAIQNVIAEPARSGEAFDMRIQQLYAYIGEKQWFPVQLNTEVTFNKIKVGNSNPVGIGKSYRRDINLDAAVIGRELANVAVEVTPDAAHQAEAVWDRYRTDSLTIREINTYRIIDSLGRKNSFDARIRGLTGLLSGQLPMGYVNLDLNRLVRYNRYEGLYLGLGLHTSDRLSRLFTMGGYAGYGFRDKDVKFGTDLLINLLRYDNLTLGLKYAYDLEEAGGTSFFDDNISIFSADFYRRFYLTRMDLSETAEAMLSFRMLRYVKAGIGVSRSGKQAAYDYAYQQNKDGPAILTSNHTFGKLIAGVKFAWGEKFVRTADKQASLGTKFPIIWLQYSGSRAGFLDGQFDYNRLDAKFVFSFITRLIGKTSIQLTGGLVDRPAPYSELFNGRGSRISNFSIYSTASFATMHTDEFISDRFAAVFITHSFGKLLYRSANFEPQLAVVFNAGIGSLEEAWRHRYADFKTMEKGYYEGGILINNLLKSALSGIGLGVFYRTGPYSFDKPADNLAFKLSVNYNL